MQLDRLQKAIQVKPKVLVCEKTDCKIIPTLNDSCGAPACITYHLWDCKDSSSSYPIAWQHTWLDRHDLAALPVHYYR